MNSSTQEVENSIPLHIKDNYALIIHCAYKYSFSDLPIDDRISACMTGFMRACREYDPSKGAKLTTYAVYIMRQELTTLRREMYPWMELQGIEPPVYSNIEDEQESDLEGVISGTVFDQEATEFNNEQRAILETAMLGLPERDKQIYCLVHGILGYEELPFSEIGEQFDISRQRAQEIYKRTAGFIQGRITTEYSKQEVTDYEHRN